ncbi:hypothetical protein ES703_95454 [subsurface metagenome]
MNKGISFKGISIVSCGTLKKEIEYLKKTYFLDADKIFFTAPGLHEKQTELEKQLSRHLDKAKTYSPKVIVVYGERCYLDPVDPTRDIDRLILEKGPGISRVQARSCIDMLASTEERERIRNGRKVYWLTTGWITYWKTIFSNWDVGLANETFPGNETVIVLDALDEFNNISEKSPEKILEFSDWMKLGIEPHTVSLDRLKNLLLAQAKTNL